GLLRDGAQRTSDLLHAVALDDVADLDVVEVGDVQTAFEALPDLSDIVLEPLEAAQLALVHLDPVPDDAHAAAALKLAVRDHAASDGPDTRNLEDLSELGANEQHSRLLRREQHLHRSTNLRGGLIDDAVEADVDPFALRHRTGLSGGPNVEADHD